MGIKPANLTERQAILARMEQRAQQMATAAQSNPEAARKGALQAAETANAADMRALRDTEATINGEPSPIPALTNENPLVPSNVAAVGDTVTGMMQESSAGHTDLGAQIPFVTQPVSSFIEHDVTPVTKAMLNITKGMPDMLKRFFNPASRDAHSIAAADLVGMNASKMRLEEAQLSQGLDKWRGAFNNDIGKFTRANPGADDMDLRNPGIQFMVNADEGVPNASQTARDHQAMWDGIFKDQVADVQKLEPKALKDLYDYYQPRIFDHSGMSDVQFNAMMQAKTGSMQGHAGFLKHRKLDPATGEPYTLRQAITPTSQGGLGLRLVTNNPTELNLLKLKEILRWKMARRSVQDLETHGEAFFVPDGTVSPKDLAKNNFLSAADAAGRGLVQGTDRAFKGYKDAPEGIRVGQPQPDGSVVWRTAHRVPGHWHIHPSVDNLFNNWTSKGIDTHLGFGSNDQYGLYEALHGINNFHNEIDMAFPSFHLIDEARNAFTADVARSLQNLVDIPGELWDKDPTAASASLFKGLKAAGHALTAPIANPIEGSKIFDVAMKGVQSKYMTPERAEAVRLATQGNFDWSRGVQFQTKWKEATYNAWQLGNYPGALARAPMMAIETIGRQLFQKLVPYMKLATFHLQAPDTLAALPSTASDLDRLHALAKLNKSVDNLMGEMNYDQLNLPKWMRQVMFILQRSPGWNLGNYRMWFNGSKDAIKLMSKGLTAGKLNPEAKWTYDMSQMVADHLTGIMIAAIGTLYLTHKLPSLEHIPAGVKATPKVMYEYFRRNYKILTAIHTGKKDRYGNEITYMPPGYQKDLLNYMTSPGTTLGHKASPILSEAFQLIGNRDYYGNRIWNPGDPLTTKVGKAAYGFLPEPFQFQNLMKAYNEPAEFGSGKAPKWMALSGFSTTSMTASTNPGIRLLMEVTEKDAGMDPGDRPRFQLRTQIEDQIRLTHKAPNLGQYVLQGKLKPSDITSIQRDIRKPPFLARFESVQRMGDQMDVINSLLDYGDMQYAKPAIRAMANSPRFKELWQRSQAAKRSPQVKISPGDQDVLDKWEQAMAAYHILNTAQNGK